MWFAMPNPYESPRVPPADEVPPPWRPGDIGRAVGRYLQVLACLSALSQAAQAFLADDFRLDLSFLFLFWAGSALMRHSRIARRLVILLSALFVVASLAIMVMTATGNPAQTRITIAGIQDLPVAAGIVWLAICALLAGIPLSLLLSPRAKREFRVS